MRLLKFSAEWCGPCKMLSATIAAIEDKPQLLADMTDLDVDSDPEVAMRYGVRGVPTLLLLDDDGNVIKRATGALSRDKLLEFIYK